MIISRIERGEEISLLDRVFISKMADKDPTISYLLNKAKRNQYKNHPKNSIDSLINTLDLGSADPEPAFDPRNDDLGEWFTGAPSWVNRS